uniref:Uncharacterized protein n=1 Tax=Panagrolaimus sp. JU765 TaxID=591449 RepID=A0AC34R4U3_9BILA
MKSTTAQATIEACRETFTKVERFVDTMKRSLAKCQNDGNLDENLDKFLYFYQSSPNGQNQENKSPAELFLGRKLPNIFDKLKWKNEEGEKDHKMANQFDHHNNAKRRQFEKEDLVWITNIPNKKPSWIPAKVVKKIGKVIYEVDVFGKIWIRHSSQMRRRYGKSSMIEPMDEESDDEDELFNVLRMMNNDWKKEEE